MKQITMQAILFYLTYPFIYLIASLPFPIIYSLSDFLFHFLRLTAYRKSVIKRNIERSFPEKAPEEIRAIYLKFYQSLSDIILETLKSLRMTEREYQERCRFHSAAWFDELYKGHKSLVVVMGHFGNWEWAAPCFSLSTKYQLVGVYRPLANPYFDQLIHKTRSRFGSRIVPETNILREMVANKGKLTVNAFIADQNAHRENSYWTTFLHQETPFFLGPEKLAIKFGYPVVYMSVQRSKRGYYDIYPTLLAEKPYEAKNGEISEAFVRALESDIEKMPEAWLWSHKRWKHNKPGLME